MTSAWGVRTQSPFSFQRMIVRRVQRSYRLAMRDRPQYFDADAGAVMNFSFDVVINVVIFHDIDHEAGGGVCRVASGL